MNTMFFRYAMALHFFFAIAFSVPVPHQKRRNYETLGGGFEGDMIFPDGYNPFRTKLAPKGVATIRTYRWPNNVVPYDISNITSKLDRRIIKRAINTFMHDTSLIESERRKRCIHFRPKNSSDTHYLKIVYGYGCSSTVGYLSTHDNVVSLAKDGCFSSGIIQHELAHALGFHHEQSRPDRDTYIVVNYENIPHHLKINFQKYESKRTPLYNRTAYDYESLMHFGPYDFSINREPTITPKQSDVTIGQREKLSVTDIDEIRAYYNC